MSNDPTFTEFEIVWDNSTEDVPHPGAAAQTYRFSPRTDRYVRFIVNRLTHRDEDNYGFALAEMQILNKGRVLSEGKAVSALDHIESNQWSLKHLNDGIIVTQTERFALPDPAPMLRKEFELKPGLRRAMVYVTARGLYELHLNGKRAGENILAPEWTDYTQRIQYQTYDVTSLLQPGANTIGAILGEGWYAGLVGLIGPRLYGDQLGFLAQLEIEYEDGSKQILVTDESWKATNKGPIRAADIIRGEEHDGRLEMPGWSAPGFDDSEWLSAERLADNGAKRTAQPNEPIQITQEIQPVQITEPKPNCFVFDLSQNMVGWIRLKIHAPSGQRITMRFAEVLNLDGSVYTKNLRDNNRRDPVDYQKDIYICRGDGEEIFEPHFTYHGFRYVEVTGLPERPSLDDLTGCVIHSAAPLCGSFECSNPLWNQLMKNIVWTQRGNMHSTPTDCPQRDERLGWMGDAQLFSQAACFNMNMAAFFTKWRRDIEEAQAEDGRFSDFSPNPLMPNNQFLAAPAWADAGVIIPWRVYENYADTRILQRHYEAAKRWVEYVSQPERRLDLG